MKRAIILFLPVLLAACGGAAPAPQVTVTSEVTVTLTPTTTATAVPTASATPTPTLPAETSLNAEVLASGSVGKWSFVANEAGNMELMVDGVARGVEAWPDRQGVTMTYDGVQYAIANPDVMLKPDGSGRIGRFEVSANGEVTPIPGCTAAELLAGKDCGPAVTIIWEKGNEHHLEIAGTVTGTRDLLMGDSIPEAEGRALAVEWDVYKKGRGYFDKEGIFDFKPKNNRQEVISAERKALGISLLEPAIFPVKIIDRRGEIEKVIETYHIPVIAKEPEGPFGLSALVPADLVESRAFLEGKNLDKLLIWLVRGTRENLHEAFIADPIILGLEAQVNNRTIFQEFSAEGSQDISWGPSLSRLPKSARQALFTFLIAQN